jgi:ADP-heptose:LPS heptosyltransferase
VKILVVRFSSIGDIVLTTPVIRALKNQIEEVEIHYLTKSNFLPLLDGNPHLTKIYAIEKGIDEVLSDLQSENYDYLIDLHHNLRTLKLKFKLGVKHFSFPKLNIKKWLLVRLKINRLPNVHIVERYFKAVEKLDVKNDGLPGELFINPSDRVNVLNAFQIENNTFVAVALGAQYKTKQIPNTILKNILEEIDLPIVLLGGSEDLEKGKALVELLPGKQIFNTCGQYSLIQSASIVIQSEVLLTGDTGLMHIAACFDLKIVSVWGNTIPELGMYPYLPAKKEQFGIHEIKHLSCRPCSKIGFQKCPKGHFNCMNLQDTKAISQDLIGRINR